MTIVVLPRVSMRLEYVFVSSELAWIEELVKISVNAYNEMAVKIWHIAKTDALASMYLIASAVTRNKAYFDARTSTTDGLLPEGDILFVLDVRNDINAFEET